MTRDPALLHIHGVGSRGEEMALNLDKRFADDVVCVNYEPDPDAASQTSTFFEQTGFKEASYPVAAAGSDGPTTLYLNYDPFTSSTLPFNSDFADFYCRYDLPNGDYILGETCAPVKRIEAPGVRLDGWCARHGLSLDYVSLDTQGSELDILKGAGDLVDTQLLAFTTEVEYQPLYQGQRLFSDMLVFARAHGFHFLRIFHHGPGSFFRGPIGWRGSGFSVSGDAIFVKDAQKVVEAHPAPRRSLMKLAFLAVHFENIEYALQCLAAAETLPASPEDEALAARSYVQFLHEMRRLYDAEEKINAPSFSDLFSAEESFARFLPGGRADRFDPVKTRQRYFARYDRALIRRALPRLLDPGESALEAHLRQHSFHAAAAHVRANRLRQAHTVVGALGLAAPGTTVDPAAAAAALDALS